jgi:hypothetical protein
VLIQPLVSTVLGIAFLEREATQFAPLACSYFLFYSKKQISQWFFFLFTEVVVGSEKN